MVSSALGTISRRPNIGLVTISLGLASGRVGQLCAGNSVRADHVCHPPEWSGLCNPFATDEPLLGLDPIVDDCVRLSSFLGLDHVGNDSKYQAILRHTPDREDH